MNAYSNVKHVIGIVSGKGGVGKSLVTSLMAVEMQRRGHAAAILDADITGPSIPRAFGVLDNPGDPVIWRGPVIAGAVKQFWTDVAWGDVDYMFVDMPPGTGDVPLTVFQSLPVDGIIVVTSPQELVDMIVAKAVNMAKMMNVPILGLVENMSFMLCPDCGRKIYPFGEGKTLRIAEEHSIPVLAQIPMDPSIAASCDAGRIESLRQNWMDGAADMLEARFTV